MSCQHKAIQPMDSVSPFGCSCTSDAGCVVFSSGTLRAEEALIRGHHSAFLRPDFLAVITAYQMTSKKVFRI